MNARLDTAVAHWSYVAPLLTPATDEADYLGLVEALDALLDAGGADENHPLAGLASMVGDLVSAWEQAHVPAPVAMNSVETLQYFMERDGLRQSELAEIGNQAKVSEILSGKRAINLRQAKALSQRFGVPMEMFAE